MLTPLIFFDSIHIYATPPTQADDRSFAMIRTRVSQAFCFFMVFILALPLKPPAISWTVWIAGSGTVLLFPAIWLCLISLLQLGLINELERGLFEDCEESLRIARQIERLPLLRNQEVHSQIRADILRLAGEREKAKRAVREKAWPPE